MKKIALAAAIIAATTAQAFAAPICLDSLRVRNTTIPDARHIIFHMQDGSTWINELRYRCPGLKWNGFVYEPFAGREVCENLQTVRALWDSQTCMLGSFTKLAPEHT
jgi:hypothetical protein